MEISTQSCLVPFFVTIDAKITTHPQCHCLPLHPRVATAVGFYQNNCRCHESGKTHYPQDAVYTASQHFDGVKIDSCGNQRDMAEWAAEFAANNRTLLVESCGNGPAGTNPKRDPTPMPAFVEQLQTTCPFTFFRVSEDVAPQFNSVVFNANRSVPYLGTTPLSRPGCWACECQLFRPSLYYQLSPQSSPCTL